MTVVAEEVTVEVGAQPINECSYGLPITRGDELVKLGNRAPLAVGRADDLPMFEIGDEQHLAHQQLGQPPTVLLPGTVQAAFGELLNRC